MKTTLRNTLKIFGVAALCVASISTSLAQNETSFCVLELFTSEGCSSCPGADNMMNTAATNADNSANNHIFLALHIEYWDYLGWTDQYADPAHDQMFFDYYNNGNGIQIISGNSFGTPIFVRNGEEGRNYSTQAQNKQATAFINMTSSDLVGDQLTVNYTLTGDLFATQARFFLVESEITSVVTAGENNGSTLHHNNVVRDMNIIPVNANTEVGTTTLTIPPNANIANMKVMAYIRKQNNAGWTREIVGATKGFKLGELGISEAETTTVVRLYPNPASDNVVVSSPEVISQIEIVDELGAVLEVIDTNVEEYVLDLSNFTEGLYFLRTTTESGTQVQKLLKRN